MRPRWPCWKVLGGCRASKSRDALAKHVALENSICHRKGEWRQEPADLSSSFSVTLLALCILVLATSLMFSQCTGEGHTALVNVREQISSFVSITKVRQR